MSDTGRQSQLWGWWPINDTQVLHEYYVTEALKNMNANNIKRASNVDQDLRPDAEFTLDRRYLLEMDMGTERTKQLKNRVLTLSETSTPVLWVALTPGRIRTIQQCCDAISDRCYFAGVEKAGESWMDYQGRAKPCAKGRVQ